MNNLKTQVGSLFGIPMSTSYRLYLSAMNEAGKITARSILDLVTITLEALDETEGKLNDLELLWRAGVEKKLSEPPEPVEPVGNPVVEAPKPLETTEPPQTDNNTTT